jgi:very-short-patch-repair endonuclease
MRKLYNRQEDNEKRKMLRHEMPKAEVLLWMHLKGKQIHGHKFRRQYGIGCYVIDLYCPKVKLAVEVDGATHLTEEEIAHDKNRQEAIEEIGIEFLRFTNLEIYHDIRSVVRKIKAKVKELSGSRKGKNRI